MWRILVGHLSRRLLTPGCRPAECLGTVEVRRLLLEYPQALEPRARLKHRMTGHVQDEVEVWRS
jgi:hypothetical protein